MSNNAKACIFFTLTCTKLCLSISIIALLFYPTDVLRLEQQQTTENFGAIVKYSKPRYDTTKMDWYAHLICWAFAKPSRNLVFDDRQIMNILSLPNGTVTSKELRKFAQCNLDGHTSASDRKRRCWCFGSFTYALLLLIASFSVFVNLFYGMEFLRYRGDGYEFMEINMLRLIFVVIGLLIWQVVAIIAFLKHFHWSDSVMIPQMTEERGEHIVLFSYFKRPVIWDLSVFCAFGHFLVSTAQCYIAVTVYQKQKHQDDKKNEPQKTPPGSPFTPEITKEDADQDQWSVVSWSSSAKEMINYTQFFGDSSLSSWP